MLSSQPSLFDQQTQNIERVRSKLEPTILRFFAQNSSGVFLMSALTNYVRWFHPDTAPDSPGRIMRQLRKARKLDYRVKNRRASLYEIVK